MGKVVENKKNSLGKRQNFLAILVFTLASSFYLYEFILQVSPSVMTTGLMTDFHVGAAGLGFIAAAYFYAYMPMQLPAGLLYDRYGPRLLLTLATLICALGAIFFSLTQVPVFAAVARIMMGVGSAFAFIGTLIVASRWFDARYYALLVGISQCLSSVGAVIGEAPVAYLVDLLGWRSTLWFLGLVGFVLAFLILLFVRDYPENYQGEKQGQSFGLENEWLRLKAVCIRLQSWYIALYAFSIWSPIIIFASLWGVPYLALRYNCSVAEASHLIAFIWLGIGIGSPFLGWWSDKIGNRNLTLSLSAFFGVVSALVLLCFNFSLFWLCIVLFFFGVAASGQSISFAVVKDINAPTHVGTASGFNNMATVAGGLILQPLVGLILHEHWQGNYANGVPVYTLSDYESGLIILPLCYLLALLVSLFLIKETHCRPQI